MGISVLVLLNQDQIRFRFFLKNTTSKKEKTMTFYFEDYSILIWNATRGPRSIKNAFLQAD